MIDRDKPRFPHRMALEVALELQALLAPVCTPKLIVAGSLRRRRALVGDIELLYVPLFEDRPVDMFAVAPFDLAAELIDGLTATGVLVKRPKSNGTFTWGPQNKLAVHVASGIPVDFFATSEECWPVALVIRTGGEVTNLKLTTGAQMLGRTLHAYGSGTTDLKSGRLTRANSEEDVFRLCGVPYQRPEERR